MASKKSTPRSVTAAHATAGAPGTPAAAITFLVPGQRPSSRSAASPAEVAASGMPGVLKDVVQVSKRRDAGGLVRVTAVPDEDVVVLRIAGGPTLVLHPENARDLMLGQGTVQRSQRAANPNAESDAVEVPAQLRWRGLEQAAPARSRRSLGDVLLSSFEVVTGLFKDKAVAFVASEVVKKVDGQVDAGVYALRAESLAALKGSGLKVQAIPAPAQPTTEPILVLIHGTFVDTFSTFGKLWALHPQRVQELFDFYGGRVYALDHATLGASPIANAMTLVQALPAGAHLHLATHSRGGLVAEVLCRVAAQPQLSAQDLAFFAGDDHAAQRLELQALVSAVRAKGITVQRVLRVACPARGTLLASKRLDAYLSVLQWSIELAGVPVLPQLVNFLSEVARRRASPQELPGLAAMIPDTPLVSWLNGAEEPISGDLRVVAGDLQGDSIGSWIKTLLADAYYWTDNDVVVQTRSMYGGSPRLAGAQFLLDQGGKVTHFNYFVNDRTVQALVQGLTQDRPPGFATIGPLSWAGQVADGARAGQSSAKRERSDGKAPHELPAVFVLPGILGSHLKVGDKRIWLSLRLVGGLSKLQYTGSADGVESDGPVGLVYDKLMAHLADSHEVKAFGFDWRRPLEEEAQRLADQVDQALDARKESGQPVRLLAHSMGGLLARTMQLERPQTFARLMQHAGARFLMLGTPNGGSWAPMQVLSGDDTFGNVLTAFGSPLRDQEARQWMAQMPGFLQLQAALTQPELQLSNSTTWRKLAQDDLARVQEANWWHRYAGEHADAAYAWGLPTQAVLDRALALRQRLDMQLESALPAFAAKTLLVVGHAPFTPDGYEVDAGEGFVYLNTPDGGDGRVTLTSALLPGVKTWTLDCDHGSLPDLPGAFGAYSELLETGDTTLLQALEQRPAQRSGRPATAADEVTAEEAAQTARAAQVRSRPSRARPSARPAQAQNAVFSTSNGAGFSEDSAPASGAALRVAVLNGNLSFVRQPLLVGHTRSLVLTGTEKAVNGLMGGALQASLDTGLYADATGSHQVFINARQDSANPWRAPQPVGVVVVGLGEEGKLNEQALALSVRQAVLAWVQRVAEGSAGALSLTAHGSPPTTIELAATLMGSGGMGMNAGTSARAIAQGVRDANDRLARTNPLEILEDENADADDATNTGSDGGTSPRRAKPARDTGWPLVSQLTLVELYLERASDAWNGLQVLAASAPGRFVIAPTIQTGKGPLRRQIDSGYRGADYDFIAATTASTEAHVDIIEFKLDTKRARTEVKAQSTQGRLLRQMVAQASTASNNDPRLGRTLFQLLVPLEVEPFLSGTSRMVLELDAGTAPIPWELLDTQSGDSSRSNEPPWAIRTQLLRKLRTDTYREQVQDANRDDAILVVGEPAVDPKQYDRLPGARSEAVAVVQALQRHGRVSSQRTVALVADNSATEVVNALFEYRYRIVHIAGHGEPVKREEQPPHKLLSKGGVVLSDGAFLGADEINSMRVVPELVFVNCCHLAAREGSQVLKPREPFNRAEFAWGVADSLINIGVRCVIAAGWAVDDGPAKEFADVFYREIMHRRPFAHAVACAREAAWNFDRESNTWAAYQCYGDPNWTYRHSESDPAAVSLAPSEEFSGVASPLGVALALEEVAVRAKWMHANTREQHKKVRHLEARFGSQWGEMGAVAEAFGVAYADTGDIAQALHWYDKALRSNDASASLKAHEQAGNLRARQAWEHLKKAQRSRAGVTAQDLSQAREQITVALRSLQALAGLQPTLERYSLCGSAWKRLALVDRLAQQLGSESGTASPTELTASAATAAAAETASLQMAHTAYRQAEMLATEQGDPQLYYPALNRIALDLMLSRSDSRTPSHRPVMDPKETAAVRLSLQEQALREPDFWVFASLVEVDQWEALAEGSLAQHLDGLLRRYADLHAKVAARGMWASLADQADLVLAPMTDQTSAAGAVAGAKNRAAAVALRKALRGYAGQAS